MAHATKTMSWKHFGTPPSDFQMARWESLENEPWKSTLIMKYNFRAGVNFHFQGLHYLLLKHTLRTKSQKHLSTRPTSEFSYSAVGILPISPWKVRLWVSIFPKLRCSFTRVFTPCYSDCTCHSKYPTQHPVFIWRSLSLTNKPREIRSINKDSHARSKFYQCYYHWYTSCRTNSIYLLNGLQTVFVLALRPAVLMFDFNSVYSYHSSLILCVAKVFGCPRMMRVESSFQIRYSPKYHSQSRLLLGPGVLWDSFAVNTWFGLLS